MTFFAHTDLNWDDLAFMYDYEVENCYSDFYDAVQYFTSDSVFTKDILEMAETAGVSHTEALDLMFDAATSAVPVD